MQRITAGRGLFAALAVLLSHTVSHAHGLDARRVQVWLRDDGAEVVATPPVTSLAFADDDRNGLLDVGEVRAHRPEIQATLEQGLSVSDDAGRAGEVTFRDVSTPHADDAPRGVDHLRLSLRFRWARPPASLSLACVWSDHRPVALEAARVAAGAEAGTWSITQHEARLITDAAPVVGLLARERPAAVNPPSAPSTPAAPAHPIASSLLLAAALASVGWWALASRNRPVSPCV